MYISDDILYIGVDDHDIDLFESQYYVPNGISYNSYVILDEKVVVMDTVDARKTNEWLENLSVALQGRTIDYLVVSHMEPDHASNIGLLCEKYPDMKLIGNVKTFTMLKQFFTIDRLPERQVIVKEGDVISIGKNSLQFFMAPMVHWPEVMVTYVPEQKVLFTADGFGKFGTLDTDEEWDCEARRYYFNIVGKYGVPVQGLLKKAAKLDIQTICPLHGPVLNSDLGHYIGLYDTWSSYKVESEGIFIAYASIHGNTAKVAEKMKEILENMGQHVSIADLAREDMAECVEDAFRYGKLIVAGASYDGGVFPCMEQFLLALQHKAYQNRVVGMIENGSWAPCAARAMKGIIETYKNVTIVDPVVTIMSTLKEADVEKLEQLAKSIVEIETK